MTQQDSLALEFGAWLRGYRAKYKLTQAQLAPMIGMPQGVVSRLEKASHQPSYETLRKVSKALGVHFKIRIEATSLRFTAAKIRT